MRRNEIHNKIFCKQLIIPWICKLLPLHSPNLNIYFHIDNHHRHAVCQTSPSPSRLYHADSGLLRPALTYHHEENKTKYFRLRLVNKTKYFRLRLV